MQRDDPTRELCDWLGLVHAPQDWGIENADAKRAMEFLDFYRGNAAKLGPYHRYQLAELIVASVNDAMEEGIASDVMLDRLRTFVRQADTEQERLVVQYRADLAGDDEFPVGQVVTDALQ